MVDYYFNQLVGGALNASFGATTYGVAPAGPVSHLSSRISNRFYASPGVGQLGLLFPQSAHEPYNPYRVPNQQFMAANRYQNWQSFVFPSQLMLGNGASPYYPYA